MECTIGAISKEGKTESDIIGEGYLARANHSIFDNASENSKKRYENMSSFVIYIQNQRVNYKIENGRCGQVKKLWQVRG